MRRKLSIAVAVLFGIIVTGYVACAEMTLQNRSFSWRYKMTVEIDTPEGLKSGSAVRDINIYWKAIGWDQINKQPHYSQKIKIDGEAVVVDLGKRGKLFALINDKANADVMNAFNIRKPEDLEKLSIGNQAKLDVSKYPGGPTLVTFIDMNDPKTVTPVMKWTNNQQGTYVLTEDHMEEIFGEGVRLKEIAIEISNESITEEVGKVLLWLRDLEKKNARLNGNNDVAIFTNELSDNLGPRSFRIKKVE